MRGRVKILHEKIDCKNSYWTKVFEQNETISWKEAKWIDMNIPDKVKIFASKVCSDIIPTSQLYRKKIIKDDLCPLCKKIPESSFHTLLLWTDSNDMAACVSLNNASCQP